MLGDHCEEKVEDFLERIGEENHEEAAAMVLRKNDQIYLSRTRE